MYKDIEIKLSKENLFHIVQSIGKNACIYGGWAVYYNVNKNFSQTIGRSYYGSRDLDLGFYIDKKWTETEIKESDFAKAITTLEKQGFELIGFRFVKHYDALNEKFVNMQESKNIPSHFLSGLYVDLGVNQESEKLTKIFGFPILDESLLTHAFESNRHVKIQEKDLEFKILSPELLIATKLNSVQQRTKDDKKQKDLLDITALLLYSETPINQLIQETRKITSMKLDLKKFSQTEIEYVVKSLSISQQVFQQTTNQLNQQLLQ
jgi:hypothetical protein